MRSRVGALVVALCCAAAPGCDGLILGISAGSSGLVIIVINPSTLPRPPTLYPPASATFSLMVQQPSEDVSLENVAIRFADGFGDCGNVASYNAADLNRMFGAPAVQKGGTRAFDFSVPYTCSPAAATQMSARVTMTTRSGRRLESTAVATIR
jgi:hypothetical protein